MSNGGSSRMKIASRSRQVDVADAPRLTGSRITSHANRADPGLPRAGSAWSSPQGYLARQCSVSWPRSRRALRMKANAVSLSGSMLSAGSIT